MQRRRAITNSSHAFGVCVQLAGCVLICALLACTVDPAKDYARTAELVSRQTGVAEPYAQQPEAVIAGRVERLLGEGVSVDEAVEITLLNNPGFLSLFEEIGISRAQVVQAGLLNNPVFSAVAKFPEAGGRISLDFGFSQELMQIVRIPIQRKIAKVRLDQTIESLALRAVELAAEAKRNYYRARALQLEEETVAANIGIVNRQLRGGSASELDVNLARAATMDVELELLAVRRRRARPVAAGHGGQPSRV